MFPLVGGLLSVDLIDHCSTYSATGVVAPILALTRSDTAPPAANRSDASLDTTPRNTEIKRPHRKWNRLSDTARADVVARYSAGETSTALAKEYGVAKSTILGILRAHSVVVRRQPLTEQQVAEAARLYEAGSSLSQVAEALKVNQETMRMAILKVGVALREPTKANQTELR
ncbi:hypothetical protein [Brachybacterium paraconglomeratum]|uniref:hypothetical protein n=1 Tax=Brachybacterium paraconglomeratum TaxID=173362 RepID=UPI0022AEA033|nr:hypothetical protein [Brachybacterium paraconglomeratum]MCZ4327902.1 hypothetical protein [Brachybacterium paraconglomeratum]